ncbi:Sialin like protein [Argiope bruennichi]|uniref:Sialin like protein n=1 Tax=Argiope bruennichi TaxID=94029 RepID=A0A8T0EHM5_ARGBR|nr:Sialin like protein [Argiope bruennichi]
MADFIPKRYVFSIVGLAATTLSVALQTNLSIAIVYMVKNTKDELSKENFNECSLQPEVTFNKTEFPEVIRGEFDWTPDMQGIALGAQYMGLAVGYIPGGRLSEVYGGKITMISTLLVSSIFTALLPLMAHLSIYAFIVCRFVIGMGTSPVFPALVYMISLWIPESEQMFISSFILAGYGTGAFVSLRQTDGGPMCIGFYRRLAFCILSGCSLKKLECMPYIFKMFGNQLPDFLGNAGFCLSSSHQWHSTWAPYSIWAVFKSNGLLSCLPNLLRAICACIVGILIDYIRSRREIPIVYIRKGATLANSLTAFIGFIGILFAGCNVTLSTIAFITAGILSDFYIFGVSLVPIDMAPNLADVLVSFFVLDVLVSFFVLDVFVSFFILDVLVSFFVLDVLVSFFVLDQSIAQWSYVYYFTIGLVIVTTIIYLLFGTSELQQWGMDQDESRPTIKDTIPKRYVFALIGLAAATLAIMLQSNLSMAIVYMVHWSNQNSFNNPSRRECPENQDIKSNLTQWEQMPYGDLDWSPETQGLAIGIQFVGIMIGCIPGGRLAEVYGSKIILISTLLLASFATALLPSAAYSSVYAFMFCRVIVGLGISPVFPVLVYMISHWIPASEQSFVSSFMLAGYGTGTFISYVAAGFLCSSDFLGGWPSVFYLSALSGLIWSIWAYFALYDEPQRHPTISMEEVDYINKHTSSQTKKVKSIPWKSMATSVPLWALAIGAFGQFWIIAFFATSLTLYMGTVLNLDSVENGYISCIPNLLRAVLACLVGVGIDYALEKTEIPITYIRKGATIANSITAVLGFAGVLYAGCDITINAIWFIIACISNDFTIFGVCLVPVDLAPHLSGTISGMMNFVITLPYIILTIMIGYLTQQEEWAVDEDQDESDESKEKSKEMSIFHVSLKPDEET